MHEEDEYFYFSYKEKDPWAEPDVEWIQDELPFKGATHKSTISTWTTAGNTGSYAKASGKYMAPAYVPDVIVTRIQKAIAETLDPIFQQIMDRLDELEDNLRGDRAA